MEVLEARDNILGWMMVGISEHFDVGMESLKMILGVLSRSQFLIKLGLTPTGKHCLLQPSLL